jgi:hypothetical protein
MSLPHVARSLLLAAAATIAAGTVAAPRLVAQDTTATANLRPTPESQRVRLTLRDGSVVIGRVISVSAATVHFASALGDVDIPRSAIRKVESASPTSMHEGEYWPEDPSRTRLFFAPTGRMQHQGEMYLADAYVFFPSLQGGVTDRFSIGAGFSLIPGLGLDEQLYYITPKVGLVAGDKVNIAIGGIVAGAGTITDAGPFGIGYGVATFGGEDGSITAGAGFGYAKSETSQAILMLGGSRRVTRNVALVSENYLYTANHNSVLVSGGFRFLGEKIAVDFAGFGVSDAEVPIIPYVAFIYRF